MGNLRHCRIPDGLLYQAPVIGSPRLPTGSMGLTFRERYCSIHRIDPSGFERHLLARALYSHAALLRSVLAALPDYLAADIEFLRCVGDIRSRRFFHAEAGEFHAHAANRRICRRFLRLRVSAERVRRIMEETWRATGESNPPVASSVDLNAR